MGTTKGTVVISYDVDSRHVDVKNEMKKLGYADTWKYQTEVKTYSLPNTTLWHSNKSSDEAIADIKFVCSRLGVKLERAIAVYATEFVGI